ncbi:MAG: DUF2703 domain-containing protein [Fibrobacter sp.]|nr:DUF2703 domain-containing protein [Fibrobacter sp.]
MQDVDLALVLEHERIHLLEERLERFLAARELYDVERRIDEVVFGEVDDVACGCRDRRCCEKRSCRDGERQDAEYARKPFH